MKSNQLYQLTRYKSTGETALYHGKDPEGNSTFLVILPAGYSVKLDKWPKLAGINIYLEEGDNELRLALVLQQANLEGIFNALINDLASSAGKIETHKAALNDIRSRLMDWHKLLNSGVKGLLSLTEQLGLMGELLEIEYLLEKEISPNEVLNAWLGPKKGPHDFVFGHEQREVKVYTDLNRNIVTISSADQLATVLQIPLILSTRLLAADEHGRSLNDMVISLVEGLDEDEMTLLNLRLNEAGYFHHPAYSENKWSNQLHSTYLISDDFPRLIPSGLPNEIIKVEYQLALSKLIKWQINKE